MYKEYRFPTPDRAFKKQKEIKKIYGYKPEVFAIKASDGSAWFSIVTPVGLIPIIGKENKKDKELFDLW